MSIAIVTATQCEGVILMFEKMFESRMFFVDKLISMGARIVLCDPHRAIVAGPSRLRGAPMTSPDIRAGMAMLLAAVAAEGTSTINNADQTERGYRADRGAAQCARRQDHASAGARQPLGREPPLRHQRKDAIEVHAVVDQRAAAPSQSGR